MSKGVDRDGDYDNDDKNDDDGDGHIDLEGPLSSYLENWRLIGQIGASENSDEWGVIIKAIDQSRLI